MDFATFPDELQGGFIKVRYKPTNRIEMHKWVEGPYGFDEQYIGDLLFSTNLSFIPVDLQFGPRGDLYVCDWYNPVKGHMQYSLRDERRDRHSGRIWRITAKGRPLQDPPRIADAPIDELDVAILAGVREAYTALDPVPADLVDRVLFAIALADLDLEVCQLGAVSELAVAGTRGDEPSRTIAFDGDSLTGGASVDRGRRRARRETRCPVRAPAPGPGSSAVPHLPRACRWSDCRGGRS